MYLFSHPIIILYICEARIYILTILLLFAYINISKVWIHVSSMYMWFKELGSLLVDRRSGCLVTRVRGRVESLGSCTNAAYLPADCTWHTSMVITDIQHKSSQNHQESTFLSLSSHRC